MKTAVMVIAAAVLLFALSAGGSYAWRAWKKDQQNDPTETAAAETGAEGTGENAGSGTRSEPGPPLPKSEEPTDEELAREKVPASVRAPHVDGSQQAVDDLSAERVKAEQKARDLTELNLERQALDAIHDDISNERQQIEALRMQVASEKESVEKYLTSLREQQLRLAQKEKELDERETNIEDSEATNIKKLSEKYNSMAPESIAKIFEKLAREDLLDTAVKILSAMKDRQAAKTLNTLAEDNEQLAAELTEKLRSLTTPNAKPKKNAMP